MDDYQVGVYVVYAAIAVTLTIWLARTLFKHGQAFLDDVFEGRPDLSVAVNRLLVIGFYLLNFGYACLMLEGGHAHSMVSAIEVLAGKLGVLLLLLGAMHFLNLLIFSRIRRRATKQRMHAPLAPHGQAPPGAVANSAVLFEQGVGEANPAVHAAR